MFNSASKFNRDLSAWDVRVVADMHNMFYNRNDLQSQSLCGYHWMQSSTAQLAFPDTLPQIAIEKDGKICHCPRGTSYQSRNKVVAQPAGQTQDPPPRLETCLSCPSGTFSPGGKVNASTGYLCRSNLVMFLLMSCRCLVDAL